jgi:hypothetical protein
MISIRVSGVDENESAEYGDDSNALHKTDGRTYKISFKDTKEGLEISDIKR